MQSRAGVWRADGIRSRGLLRFGGLCRPTAPAGFAIRQPGGGLQIRRKQKWGLLGLLIVGLVLALALPAPRWGGPAHAQQPTATTSPTETLPAETATATSLPTDTPTPLPTETATKTPTEVPAETATPAPTEAATPTEAPIQTPTETAGPSPWPTDTPTPVSPSEPTATPFPTATLLPTATSTATPTATATPLPTTTLLPTATPATMLTLTPTFPYQPTVTPTATLVRRETKPIYVEGEVVAIDPSTLTLLTERGQLVISLVGRARALVGGRFVPAWRLKRGEHVGCVVKEVDGSPRTDFVLARGPYGAVGGEVKASAAGSVPMGLGSSLPQGEQLSETGNDSRAPLVAVDGQGHLHVVWFEYERDSGRHGLFYTYWDGSGWSNPGPFPGSQEGAFAPAMVTDGEGGVHLLWVEGEDDYGDSILHSRYDGSGWTTPEAIPGLDPASYYSLDRYAVAADAQGDLHVAVWAYHLSPYYSELFHLERGVTGWSSPTAIGTTWGWGSWSALAVEGDDDTHVAWVEEEEDSYGYRLKYARQEGGDGFVEGAEIYAKVGDGVQSVYRVDSLALAFDGEGKLHVLWQEVEHVPDMGDGPTFLRHSWSDEEVWSDALLLMGASGAALAVDSEGYLHAAWFVAQSVALARWNGLCWDFEEVVEAQWYWCNCYYCDWPVVGLAIDRQHGDDVHLVWDRSFEDVGNGGCYREVFYHSPRPEFRGVCETRVNDDPSPGDRGGTAVAVAVDGTVYAVWADYESGDVRLDRDGGSGWGADVVVASAVIAFRPGVAVDGRGWIYVVWGDDEERYVYVSRSTDGGLSWSAPQRVHDDPQAVRQMEPALAVGPEGTVYVAWIQEDQSGYNDIHLARQVSGEGSWQYVGVVNEGAPSCCCLNPDIAVDGKGTLHLIWVEMGDLYYRTSADGGESWSAAVKVNNEPGEVGAAALAVAAGGRAYAVWEDGRAYEGGIYVAASDDWSENVRVGPGRPVHSQERMPDIALDAEGRAYVVWIASYGVSEAVYLSTSDDWSEAVMVNSPVATDRRHPAVAVTSESTVHVVWEDARRDGQYSLDIYHVRMEGEPPALWVEVDVSTDALTTNTDGWPTPNPLVVTVTLKCPADVAYCNAPLFFDLSSQDQKARFYVYDSDLLYCDVVTDDPNSPYSFKSYTMTCPGFELSPDTTATYRWWVWVQPSDVTTLDVSATWWDGERDTEQVGIPQAHIHPVVFIHGILGSMPPDQWLWTERPPQHGLAPAHGVLDPFAQTYYPLLDHLEAMGYEWGKTLFALTYDWRDSNDVSAMFLKDRLADTVIPQSTSSPYVAADGKADLVVHSMGGLVSRAYIQSDDYAGDVHKVIFIATPHRGFACTYRQREGLTWSNYTNTEVSLFSDATLMGELMDGVLWPYLIEEKYDPTPDELDEDCTWIPSDPLGGLGGNWNCRRAHYKWTHHPTRGVSSLYEMLPTEDMGVYLFGENDEPWPCSAGAPHERNRWLEELNANIPGLEAALGLDNIYAIYSDTAPDETDKSYTVKKCQPDTFGRWPYGKPVGDPENTAGDNLIPANSTSLRKSGLLALADANEESIPKAGHKGIVYERETQRKVAEFLTGSPLTGTVQYVPPCAVANLIRIIAIIVRSPVEIMVTDPAGQRVGYDPATGEMVGEIPGAFYTGQGEVQFMLLYNTLPGEYRITATGMGEGDYELEAFAVDEKGVQRLAVFTGTVTVGQVVTHTTAYTVAGATLFFDDMESGGANWSAQGGWALSTGEAHSPVTAWNSGVVTPGEPLTLTLQVPLDLSEARMASLTFWHSYTLSGQGQVQVEVSTDGGENWQTLAVRQDGEQDWTPVTMRLTSFAGPDHPPLRLRFRLLPGSAADRWLIDDVQVEALEPPALYPLPFEDDVERWRRWDATGDWAVVTDTVYAGQHSWGAAQDGSVLTLAGQLDLREVTTPRLSFWHLLEGDGAAGVVEVSPDGTTWLTLTAVGATEGAWQWVEADLSAYAGQTIHLRLRLDAPDGGAWWVDDIAAWEAVPPVVHTLPFSDDMETPGNWRPVGAWQVVTDTAHSGTTAWRGTGKESVLLLVDRLDLSGAVSPTLTFWQRFILPEGSVAQVKVTADEGLTWQPVLTVTGPISDWAPVSVDLSAYAGRQVGLAFYLDEIASGEGASATRLEPSVSRAVASASASPLVPVAGGTLSLMLIVLVGVVGTAEGGQEWRLWVKRAALAGVVLAVGWVCCSLTGWRCLPPVRYWLINRLDEVKGGKVELVVPAQRHAEGADLSPDGRRMLVAYFPNSPSETDWLLLDLVEKTERKVELDVSDVRWLESDLFAVELGNDDYYLISVPELEATPLVMYPKEEMDGVREVELLRRADRVYAVENLGITGYIYIALDEEFRYVVIPKGLPEEQKALLGELPQAVVVPQWPHSSELDNPWARYYSPDDTLYADMENRALVVRTTDGNELVAQVRKRGYHPAVLGWTADGSGVYFLMSSGGGYGEIWYPERPIYLLRLPDAGPVSTSTPSSKGRVPGLAAPLAGAPDAQTPPEGWYIDDVLVQDVAAPTPTPTNTPTPTPTDTPTATPTNTFTPTPTDTPTATPTNTPTLTPTNTPTPTDTATPTPTSTSTATSTNTPTSTPTNTPIPTLTATPTVTPTPPPDTRPPISRVRPLFPVRIRRTFTVRRWGFDPGRHSSGIESFDVQYREDFGPWVDWLMGTTDRSARFMGRRGHLYFFRCRARDRAGNLEAWPKGPDTFTYILPRWRR